MLTLIHSWLYPAADAAGSTSPLSSAAAEVALSDGVDRISSLPDDLLRDIVSRLPARDGARTAALASRWRSAPLFLCDSDFLLASFNDRDRARATAGRVLADHPGPFCKIQLTYCVSGSRQQELMEWARLLATKGVWDLSLRNRDAPEVMCPLPDDILSCASLHRLFLGHWIFPDTAALARRGTDVVFPLLKRLIMSRTNMEEHDLQHMLVCSPKLKILGLVLSTLPRCICLRGPSLQCMLLWMSEAEELTVVDAPHLERLILWRTCANSGDNLPMVVKIDRASVLRVLGYLDPRVHQLHIGNVVINAETKPDPSSTVPLPGVKILALKVNLDVYEDVNMLPSFLKCFPNVETLHIESSILGETTGMDHAKFWRNVHPIECLKSHVKKIVIHDFRGEPSEFEFLMFIAKCAEKLQVLLFVLTKETSASTDEADKVNHRLKILFACPWLWAAEKIKMKLLVSEEENFLSFPRASDLSVNDPFMIHIC